MNVLDAIILAVVQGLTEFLPVSSKTHLLFTRHLLKLPVDLFFDVTLHLGSLAAILVYYRKSWLELLRERRGEIPRLVIATVPLIVAALLFRKYLAAAYENLILASAMLLVTAAWLFAAERFSREKEGVLESPWWKIVLIGLAQACAVLPGISRSGSTIGMGYLVGLKRPDAVRFSFFMGAIAIVAAMTKMTQELVSTKARPEPVPIVIGIAVTFVVSIAAIRVVEKLSPRGRFLWFALYCAVAGIVGLICFGRG
ncbi:MAG: undecaprenyl-diphosphate phosphatase [Planctomycetota bacterium]|nr:MAG: undecaprenyl-diphosphate phosphatase [Planctomycetota bacterium]